MNPFELLKSVLTDLQQEFPEANLHEVSASYIVGERRDNRLRPEAWSDISYRVQVNNESGSADSIGQALEQVRAHMAVDALIPGYAERVVAVMREVPVERHLRELVLQAVRRTLDEDDERRRG